MNLLQVESYKRGIIFSTGFNIVNKGLSFLNGILVAYFFGAQPGTDIYFYLYNFILISGAFFTSLNSSVLIPESMRLRETEGTARSTAFLNFFSAGYACLYIIAVLLVAIQPTYFFSQISNFESQDLNNHKVLLYLSLPLFILICIINLFTDILTSYKFFTVPMIVGIINGTLSIIFICSFHDYGIHTIMYGLLLSYSLNFALLVLLLKRYLKWSFFNIQLVKEKRVWKNLIFALSGTVTSTVASYTPMYILSGYNTGIITALTFAQQISSLPTVLITNQFSAVAGIKFNELYSKRQLKEIGKVFKEAADFLHFLTIPISCYIFFFSDDIVKTLLGFTSLNEYSTNSITLFLRYLGLMLPLYVINSLIARMFMASHQISQAFWYQIIFNVILITAMYFSIQSLGIIGYPLALIICYTLNLLASYFIEKKCFGFIAYKAIISDLFRVLLLNIFISFAVFGVMTGTGLESPILRLLLAFILYLILLLIANAILRLNLSALAQWHALHAKIKKNNLT